MIDVPTAREIRHGRMDAGLTQSELADRAGISQPALSKIESGTNDPRLSTMRAVAEAINNEL